VKSTARLYTTLQLKNVCTMKDFLTSQSSRPLLLEGKETGPVGETVVVATGVGVAALVQQLQVARVDSHGLVVGDLDQVSVGDVVGPGGTAVGLAGEGVLLGSSVGGPAAAEAGGSERAEVAATRADGLDDHEVLLGGSALDGVDLDSLEEVVLGVAHDDGGGSAEVAGEVALGHAGAVDLAVVTGEEQVHVGTVTDQGLVNGTSAGAGDGSREEGLGRTPAVGVGGVGGGLVGEGGRSPLVGNDPGALRLEVEESGRDETLVHGVLGSRCELVEIGDEAEVHGAVLGAGVVVGGVDEVLAVDHLGGEVLEVGPSGLGLGKSVG